MPKQPKVCVSQLDLVATTENASTTIGPSSTSVLFSSCRLLRLQARMIIHTIYIYLSLSISLSLSLSFSPPLKKSKTKSFTSGRGVGVCE